LVGERAIAAWESALARPVRDRATARGTGQGGGPMRPVRTCASACAVVARGSRLAARN
jgi:hypothetical protein